ncbi:hypothetical protein NDU88_004116 [Pleurodeles waltl]|uniref:Uncharacterized protein n=1 Tax=Pleurodeles waltl TaxID=8319 RepID=A0AAV7NIV2_PLEWA|nr:hypothetical protein NDU88_004116 [Pleurodeles waltl]
MLFLCFWPGGHTSRSPQRGLLRCQSCWCSDRAFECLACPAGRPSCSRRAPPIRSGPPTAHRFSNAVLQSLCSRSAAGSSLGTPVLRFTDRAQLLCELRVGGHAEGSTDPKNRPMNPATLAGDPPSSKRPWNLLHPGGDDTACFQRALGPHRVG